MIAFLRPNMTGKELLLLDQPLEEAILLSDRIYLLKGSGRVQESAGQEAQNQSIKPIL